ncbi:MAG: hypothetical protein AB8G18_01350 [Gammaproteobacteria bacterium]
MKKTLALNVAFLTLLLSACVSSSPEVDAPTNRLVKTAYGEPAAGAPRQIVEFGRLAGRWRCGVNERRSDGSWRTRPDGVIWTFFYTLNGLAVQDIWTSEDQSQVAEEGIATSLRIFNSATQTWQSSWTNTQQATFELWSGGNVDGEMVLTSVRDQRPVKIRFFNILKQQFQWTYEAATNVAGTEFVPVMQLLCQRLD